MTTSTTGYNVPLGSLPLMFCNSIILSNGRLNFSFLTGKERKRGTPKHTAPLLSLKTNEAWLFKAQEPKSGTVLSKGYTYKCETNLNVIGYTNAKTAAGKDIEGKLIYPYTVVSKSLIPTLRWFCSSGGSDNVWTLFWSLLVTSGRLGIYPPVLSHK